MTRFSSSRLGIALLPRKKALRQSSNTTFSATRWGESTHAELAWGRSRSSAIRWGIAGALVGALVAVVCFAPARWLANQLSLTTQQQFMLTDARGTVWSGDAVAVLTGGPGSNDARALPGRLSWTLRPQGLTLLAQFTHACCLNAAVPVVLKPGLGSFKAELPPSTEWIGQWPTDWLAGLGTPWNTLELGGTVRLLSSGMAIHSTPAGLRISGGVNLELMGVSSRLSTLDSLGSYRLSLQGAPLNETAAPIDATAATPSNTAGNTPDNTSDNPQSNGAARITLSTIEGALQLNGNGTWGRGGVRFQGVATSREADDAALANLLNIIGRRDGAQSVISIGSP